MTSRCPRKSDALHEAYTYDAQQRLTEYTTSGSSSTYGYDTSGNLTSLPDGTTQSFNSAGELSTVTAPNGSVSHYHHDAAGNLTSIISPSGPDTDLEYDPANHLTSFTDNGVSANYAYNGNGLRVRKKVGTVTDDFAWDLVGGSVPLMISDGKADYVYGPNDLPIEQHVAPNDIHMVATATATDSDGFKTTLDAAFSNPAHEGDLILLAINTAASQTVKAPAGYTQLGRYQESGVGGASTLFRKTAVGGETDATVSIDIGNSYHPKTLVAAIFRGVSSTDPIDSRTSAGSGPFSSVAIAPAIPASADGDALVQIQSAVDDLSANPTWTFPPPAVDATVARAASSLAFSTDPEFAEFGSLAFINKPGQLELAALTLRPAVGSTLYIQHDQQGSTRLLTNNSGEVKGTYRYNPYGFTVSHTGTEQTPLRYTGQYQDDESGLYYLRARYYNPATGSFLTRDPLEDLTGEAYGYVGGDPLNAADPSGLRVDLCGDLKFPNYGGGCNDAITGPNGMHACPSDPESCGNTGAGLLGFIANHIGDIATGGAAAACVAAFFDFGVTAAGCAYISGAAFGARVVQRGETQGLCPATLAEDFADLVITALTFGAGTAIERGLAELGGTPLEDLVKLGIQTRGTVVDLLAELILHLGEIGSG